MRRPWLVLLAFPVAAPVFAAASTPAPVVCLGVRSIVRQIYEHEQYSVPRGVSRIMLAAIKGDTNEVRAGLATMPASEARYWRLEAMDEAAYFNQAAVVAALLDDGVDPNAPVPKISFKPVVSAHASRAPDLASNRTGLAPPAIFGAIECHELAVTKLLLRHGANPNYQYKGSQFAPLLEAVVEKDAPIVRALLNAGADVCAEDRRLTNLHKRLHGRIIPNEVAYVARNEGLPPATVHRLTCHASSPSN